MNGLSKPTAPAPRAVMLWQAGRILLVSFLGWAAGAGLIWRFATGTLAADLGLLVAAALVWAAIPLSILRVVRHRTRAPRTQRPRTWGIWFVLASLTGSMVIGIVRPLTEDWTTLQIWSAVFLLTPLGIALDTVPRLIRPAGWTSIRAGARRAVQIGLLASSLVAFGVAMALAEGVLRAGRMTLFDETPISMIGPELAVVATVLGLLVLIAYAVGLPLVAYAGIGLLYAGFSFLVQLAWLPVVGGLVDVDGTALLALHIAAALALIVATAVVQVFRAAGPSAAEDALVDWLRAEAILPEKPAVEGTAVG
jgi:hypothetical protein